MEDNHLELKISAKSDGAASSLDSLIAKLDKLSAVMNKSSGGKVLDILDRLAQTANKAGNGAGIVSLANGLQALASVDKLKLGRSDGNILASISSALDKLDVGKSNSLGNLAFGLSSLSSVKKFQVTKGTANTIDSIVQATNGISPNTGAKLMQFGTGLGFLSNLPQVKLGNTGRQIKQMVEGLKDIDPSLATNAAKLVKAMEPFSKLQKSNLGSYITPLTKLPQALASLQAFSNLNFDATTDSVERLVKALKPLSGLSKAGVNSMKGSSPGGVFGGINNMFSSGTATLGGYLYLSRRLGQAAGTWVRSINAYVENMNLFSVSLGEFSDDALRYSQKVQDALGLDISTWIRDWGTFNQILSGFGIKPEKAYAMSKTLTQLAYDASSFFNLPFDQAVQKFQSGIAGELEPLRRIGYALDQATLQQVAYRHGINKLITDMTQAEKAQIRFVAIFEQSKNVMGDLSRTIMTPANAMRIFKSQVIQLTRALGSLFIPILMQVIPYLIAFAQVLTSIVQYVAKLLGFEMPVIDYSGAANGIGEIGEEVGDVGEGFDDATAKAKEFKNFLAGFDEMYVIPSQADVSGNGGGGAGAGLGGDLGLPDLDYDFLAGANSKVATIRKKIEDFLKSIYNFLKPILPMIEAIGQALLLWLGIKKIVDILSNILGLSAAAKDVLWGILSIVGGITLGFVGMKNTFKEVLDGTLSKSEGFFKALGYGLAEMFFVAFGLIKLGVNPLVAIPIAAAVTAVTAFVAWAAATHEKHVEDIQKKWFNGITLTEKQVERMVQGLTSRDIDIKIGLAYDSYTEAQAKLETLRSQLNDFRAMEILLKLGLNVVTDDELLAKVEGAIKNVQEYIDAEKKTLALTFDLVLGTSPLGGDALVAASSTLQGFEAQKNALHDKLIEIIEDAKLTEEERETKAREIAQQLIALMTRVDEYVREIEWRAESLKVADKLGEITMGDIDENKIDWASIKAVMEGLNTKIQEELDKYDTLYYKAKATLEYELDNAQTEEEKARISALIRENEIRGLQTRMSIIVEPVMTIHESFGSTLNKVVKDAFDGVEVDFEHYTEFFHDFISEGSQKLNVENFSDVVYGMSEQIEEVLYQAAKEANVDPRALQDAIKQYYNEVFSPMMDELQPHVEKMASIGARVDEKTRQSFEIAAQTAAMAGMPWANEVLIGMDITKHPNWEELLNRTRDSAGQIPENIKLGVLANISNIMDAIREGTIVLTPEMEALLTELGVNVPQWLADGNNANKKFLLDTMTSTGREAIEKLSAAISDEEPELKAQMEQVGLSTNETLWGAMFDTEGNPTDIGLQVLNDLETALNDPSGNAQLSEAGQALVNLLKSYFGEDWTGASAEWLKSKNIIIQNLSDNTGEIGAAATDLANSVTNPLNKKLQESESWLQRTINKVWEFLGLRSQIDTPAYDGWNAALPAVTSGGGRSGRTNYSPGVSFGGMYARGGFPDFGDLFIANEEGAEFVGSIDGRTAVANNYQIEAGVARGVYEAMRAAINKEGDPNDEAPSKGDLATMLLSMVEMLIEAMHETSGTELKVERDTLFKLMAKGERRESFARG